MLSEINLLVDQNLGGEQDLARVRDRHGDDLEAEFRRGGAGELQVVFRVALGRSPERANAFDLGQDFLDEQQGLPDGTRRSDAGDVGEVLRRRNAGPGEIRTGHRGENDRDLLRCNESGLQAGSRDRDDLVHVLSRKFLGEPLDLGDVPHSITELQPDVEAVLQAALLKGLDEAAANLDVGLGFEELEISDRVKRLFRLPAKGKKETGG